jgi:hypothetical protein
VITSILTVGSFSQTGTITSSTSPRIGAPTIMERQNMREFNENLLALAV